VKVLLIEDHPIVRAGCGRLLQERPRVEVIEAETAAAGLAAIAAHAPDLVILDLNLPDARGLDVLKEIKERSNSPRVIIFSMYEEPAFVSAAIDAGAGGYVSKNDDPDALLDALDAVTAGQAYLSRSVAQKLALARLSGEPADPLSVLTERERELVGLLAAGQSLAEVADAMKVSYRTAAELAARLRGRLSLRTNAALIKFAVEATGDARRPG
jgi:two-component system invasion response regulator UvrY